MVLFLNVCVLIEKEIRTQTQKEDDHVRIKGEDAVSEKPTC